MKKNILLKTQLQIEALLRERRGYLAQGLLDSVQEVDDSLAYLGYEVETSAVDLNVETASLPVRKRRRAVTDGNN